MSTGRWLGRRALLTVGAPALAGLLGAMALGVMAGPPAVAATGTGSASGGSTIGAFVVGFTPICVNVSSLKFTETGKGTYSASAGGKAATYNGPVTLTMELSKAPAYTGPFGSYGYDDTCKGAPGSVFNMAGTTMGTGRSGSVMCSYTGTLTRTNPSGGNGSDKATALLSGTCSVRQGKLTVGSSPTTERRTEAYILNSCPGRPPTSCKDNDTFSAAAAPGNPGIATIAPSKESASIGSGLAAVLLVAFLLIAAGPTTVVVRRRRGRGSN